LDEKIKSNKNKINIGFKKTEVLKMEIRGKEIRTIGKKIPLPKFVNVVGFGLDELGRGLSFLPEDIKVNLIKKELITKNKFIQTIVGRFFMGLFWNYKGNAFTIKQFPIKENKFRLKIPFGSYMSKRYYYNKYDTKFVNLLSKYLLKNDVYVDVGANMGFTSLVASCFSDNIFAFEPIFIKKLEENIKLNPNKNIKFFPFALSEHNGEIDIFLGKEDYSNTINPNYKPKNYNGSKKIKVKKFDDLNINADFIKIDVDGHEYEVLKGMVKSLKNIKYIYCEVFKDNYHKVNQLLESHGFKYDKNIRISSEHGNQADIFYQKTE
jgi:FkbM family methyltransferase